MEITGKIVKVLPTQSGQGKNGEWVKNFFVIEFLENQHPVQLCMEVFGADKWDKMKQNIVVNNQVNVRYSVSSHEYNGRWFTSCQCYYCASTYNGQGQQRPSPVQAPQQQGEQQQDDSPLPF
jgi:hypothetical protein